MLPARSWKELARGEMKEIASKGMDTQTKAVNFVEETVDVFDSWQSLRSCGN
jgi:hypothetical protein